MSDLPLVSAIMPTRGRVGWAHDAKRMFEEQTYPNKELVIVDDIMEPSFSYGVVPGAIYSTAPRVPIGEKRNMCVARANGQIIMHWDSDDIYRSDRMEHQATLLMTLDVDMVGYNTMELEDADYGGRWFYRCSPGSAIGVSQAYWRDSWEKIPFERLNVGEDCAFSHSRSVYTCDADGRIVARIHHGNTSDKRIEIPKNSNQWKRMYQQDGVWKIANA